MTLSEIEAAIKKHLAENHGLANAKVSVDVGLYNSMVYYVITDGAGTGDRVVTLPVTGRETVLDAIGEIGGLPAVGSRKNIWIARPIPDEPDMAQILPVDWIAISKHGATGTNYQIQPGDRIYVKADKLIAADSLMGKLIAPVERVMGAITLFDITIESLQFSRQNQGGLGF
jgi:protein involved in polysaccharide export with SLBB domain